MNVKSVIIAGVALLAAGTSQALPCDPNQRMSFDQINANVIGKYTCVGASPNASWNELLSGGNVVDFKLGAGHPTDPTATVGTYSVSGVNDNATGGNLNYSYTGGSTFSFNIDTGTGGTAIGASPFTFCPVGGGANIVVNVQTGPC